MKLIMPNENPDLDGAASAYAYSELLKKQAGEDEEVQATAAVFGEVNEETEEILEKLEEEISDATYYIYSAEEVVIISASSMEGVSTRIRPSKVVKIIDHEQIQTDDFPNAELEIEEDLNTASAIIGEKFRDQEIEISREAAKLLYEAINSAEETTERDQEIADWLETESKN